MACYRRKGHMESEEVSAIDGQLLLSGYAVDTVTDKERLELCQA